MNPKLVAIKNIHMVFLMILVVMATIMDAKE